MDHGVIQRAWVRPALLYVALLLAVAAPAHAGTLPQVGDVLPRLSILSPARDIDRTYLGVSATAASFGIQDIQAKATLIEIIGVYCPFCHEQTPYFNKLLKQLKRQKLDSSIKLVALASGASQPEIEYLREHSKYTYPIVRDEDYTIHSQLGEPKTPFIMVVDPAGKVLFTHLGVIKDTRELMSVFKQAAAQ